MADETTQTGEDTSWWAFDGFADSELPSTAFDEPLEWPETLDWGDFEAADGDLQFPEVGDLESEPLFPLDTAPPAPDADAQWEAADDDGDATMPHVTVLSGLGGGAAPPAPAPASDHAALERFPDSLWAPDPGAGTDGIDGGHGSDAPPLVTTTMGAPTFYAEPDRAAGGWRQRFDLRHGNAAVIALISFASLVLLGMFMSVRARNDLPDTSQTRTTSDQIAVQGTLNTIPLTTTVTTTAPGAINIADLIPPPEDTTTVTAGAAGGSGGGGGSTATTGAPARSAPAGGGGGTATTQPAPQPTATTAAPAPEPTTPAPTAPPVDQTTPTTPRRTMPTFPNSTVPDDGPTYTIPSIPGFTIPPGFGN